MAELEVYGEVPESAMVIVAHPDDAEFMVAGTMARWTRAGTRAVIVIVTNGNKGSSDPAISPATLARTRRGEQQDAARILGVDEVEFLDYEDGMVEPTLALRRDLTRVIRKHKPQLVVLQDPTRYFGGKGYLNHPDHRAVPEAALGAIYPAARDRLTFPELLAAGFGTHNVKQVFLGWPVEPDTIVDISETIGTKVEALLAHASQMGDWHPGEMVETNARDAAKDLPFSHGETFRSFTLDE